MKPLVVILGIFVAAAAGAAGGMLASTPSPAVAAPVEVAEAPAKTAHASNGAAPAAHVEGAGLAEQVNQLSNEVARLQAELLAIREGRVRESAAAAPTTNAAEAIPDDLFAAQHRGAILRVIEEDRAALAKKAEEERRAKDAEQSLARAERNGRELGLSTTQTRSLADFYVLETDKRNEFFKDMRNGNFPADRETARTAFAEYREWRTTELTARIGADNLARLNEIDGGGGPGFAQGRAFGGDGNNNANGGGNDRPNRRRNNGGNGGGNANPNGGGTVVPNQGGAPGGF